MIRRRGREDGRRELRMRGLLVKSIVQYTLVLHIWLDGGIESGIRQLEHHPFSHRDRNQRLAFDSSSSLIDIINHSRFK